MSKSTLTIVVVLGAVFLCGIVTGEPVPAILDTTGSSDTARYLIRIDRAEVTPLNVAETLDVTIQTFGWPYAACAFKVGTTSKYIDITSIERGDVIDSCKWEFFRASRVNTESKELYPRTLWSVVALAKFTADSSKPPCLGLNREASFMRLVVTSAPNFEIKDSTASIFFFWEDCRDNTLSDASGATLLISRQVFDYYDTGKSGVARAFPTRSGTPDACINPQLKRHPERKVEFHNGGLKFVVSAKKSPPATGSTKTN